MMAFARPFQILLPACLFWLTTASSHALQLGETEAQVTARHGAPAVEDHGRRLAVYFWEGWSAQVEFQNGVVGKLTYRSNRYLEAAEIQSLLQANGGAARWRETTSLGAKARQWVRDDQAVAVADTARPTGMVFQTGSASSGTLTPAEAILTDSFLKFDAQASAPTPGTTPAISQNEPTVQSNAPRPQLRSEPELRTDAAQPAAAPAVVEDHAASTPVIGASPADSGGKWRVVGGVTLALALLAAALACWLAKRKPATPRAQPARPAAPSAAPETPLRGAGDAPDLASLRGDQIELLLGEIFRRQGYTIELSAALPADGGSDLTLRRDGESIPVRSQDWKAARVTGREVREFYALMAGTAAPRGVLVTTGGFSRDAHEFAREKSIELIDGSGLDQRIAAVRRPGENFFDVPAWIEDFTASARIFDPECPCCGQAMVIRRHRTAGSDSWVCATYPRCAGKRAARPDLLTLPAAA